MYRCMLWEEYHYMIGLNSDYSKKLDMIIPDIIELTWVCTQDTYTTVYHVEKDNVWVPYSIEMWCDGCEY